MLVLVVFVLKIQESYIITKKKKMVRIENCLGRVIIIGLGRVNDQDEATIILQPERTIDIETQGRFNFINLRRQIKRKPEERAM